MDDNEHVEDDVGREERQFNTSPDALGSFGWMPSAAQLLILQQIALLEGSDTLPVLPNFIMKQLAHATGTDGKNPPDCVRKVDSRPFFTSASGGNRTIWFADFHSDEVFLAAKYSYPNRGQIIVVWPSEGLLPNGEDAGIVTPCEDLGRLRSMPNGIPTTTTLWEIWDPQQTSTVNHRIKKVSALQSSSSKAPKTKKAATASPLALKRSTAGFPTKEKEGESTPITKHDLRQRRPFHPKPPATKEKRLRLKNANTARARKAETGTQEEEPKKIKLKMPLRSPTRSSAISPLLPPSHRREPIFIFKRLLADPHPRTRGLRDCDSAEKLFANAFVAGVASKTTYLLKVQVNDHEPITVVRGDQGDFLTILQQAEDVVNSQAITIVVTAGDLDL